MTPEEEKEFDELFEASNGYPRDTFTPFEVKKFLARKKEAWLREERKRCLKAMEDLVIRLAKLPTG